VDYGIVGKFSCIVFLKKRYGIWNSWQVFLHSLSKKRYGILNNWQVFFRNVFNNGVDYGIVGKFSFIVFLKNGMEYGIAGKFSFIVFIRKRGGIIFSFFRVFTKKRAKGVFLFQMCPLASWRISACRSAMFLRVIFVSVFQCFCFQQDRTTSNIYKFYTYTLSMSVKPNFFFWNLFCKFDSRFRILLGTFYWELGRVSVSYSFRVPTPTGVAKRYRLLLMCRLHKACDLMTFKSLKIRSLFLNLLPHPHWLPL